MAPPFLLANCPDLPATTWVARIMMYRTGAGSPGMGSNSAGMLMSGTTYSVVPSELLQAAGHVGMFTGYVIIMTDFTDAYGFVFVTDFAGFTSATTVRIRDPVIP